MQDPANELPRTPIPRRWVNKGQERHKKEERGQRLWPRSSYVPSYLQPGVVVVCPGGWHFAFPACGPPPLLPGPKDGAANATVPNDIVSAIASAAINNVMRFLIASHLPSSSSSPFPKQKPASNKDHNDP